MKRWQWIATTVLLGLLVLLSRAGTALAQDGGEDSEILSFILAKIAALVDNVLGFWVSGGTLTDPMGEGLAFSLATIVQSLTVFVAQFSLLF